MQLDLRKGTWQSVLSDVETDLLLFDAPYSRRVHAGNENLGIRDALGYDYMDEELICEHVNHWSPRTRGWYCSITSHDLIPVWTAALLEQDRYVFAPVPIIDRGMSVRLQGDGPSSWTCYLLVARPRTKDFACWGTTPGAYIREPGDRRSGRRGGKPLGIMRKIVKDYSKPGDMVIDTHAGEATTLIAANLEGRNAIGAEVDPATYEAATRRLHDIQGSTKALNLFLKTH